MPEISSAVQPWGKHPRNGNGSEWGQMPWWVRAVAVIGVPGVLVIYLVYSGAQELPAIRRAADQNLQETLRNRELIREHMVQADANYRLLQRICSNTAKTDEDRNRCFD